MYQNFKVYLKQYKERYPNYPESVLAEWAYDDCENEGLK